MVRKRTSKTPRKSVRKRTSKTPRKSVRKRTSKTVRKSVRKSPSKTPRKSVRKRTSKTVRKSVRKSPSKTPRKSVRKSPSKTPRKSVRKRTSKTVRKSVRKRTSKTPRKSVRKRTSKTVRKSVRKRTSKTVRKSVRKRTSKTVRKSVRKRDSTSSYRKKKIVFSPEVFRKKNKEMEELKEIKNIGIIFHWGLYSIPAYDDIQSARRRSEHSGGGSEWIQSRLNVKEEDYRPPSGWKNAQKYFSENFPGMTYKDLVTIFNPTPDFDEWMKVAKKAGASYVILTSRHHDGFALWPSKVNRKWASNTDYVKKFRDAAKKNGLRWGIYYSLIEFKKGFTLDYIKDVVKPQLDELKAYQPDIWWFDGHWNVKSKAAQQFVSDYVKTLRRENPTVEINDRLGEEYKTRKEKLDWLGDATFRNFEDRYLPPSSPTVPWEHINTIGKSWGRNKQQEKQDYKTGKNLYEIYEKVNDLGGRFLINLGPDGDGSLDPNEVNSLKVFGKLLRGKEPKKSEKEIKSKKRKYKDEEFEQVKKELREMLESLLIKDLKEMTKKLGISGYSGITRKNKDEWIDKLMYGQ